MSTPSPYAPVVLPFDARDQIERALRDRPNHVGGAAAVMSLLMQWPCVASPSSAEDTPAAPEPRVWATADDVPQDEPDLTIRDDAGDIAARITAGKWAWTALGDLVITVRSPYSWPMEDMQFPVTEVLPEATRGDR